MSPNDADRMAKSVDPDQTAPLGAVWSGSALFAQAYLSENLRYWLCIKIVWWDQTTQQALYNMIKALHTAFDK